MEKVEQQQRQRFDVIFRGESCFCPAKSKKRKKSQHHLQPSSSSPLLLVTHKHSERVTFNDYMLPLPAATSAGTRARTTATSTKSDFSLLHLFSTPFQYLMLLAAHPGNPPPPRLILFARASALLYIHFLFLYARFGLYPPK